MNNGRGQLTKTGEILCPLSQATCGQSRDRNHSTGLANIAMITRPALGRASSIAKSQKSRASVPKAEISKEHLRAIDEDHQIHDFQITRSARFSLSEVSVGVRAVSRIATFGHSRISLRRYLRRDVHFSTASPCIYKTQTIIDRVASRLLKVAAKTLDRHFWTTQCPEDRRTNMPKILIAAAGGRVARRGCGS
jgi:hypothetical protein